MDNRVYSYSTTGDRACFSACIQIFLLLPFKTKLHGEIFVYKFVCYDFILGCNGIKRKG